MYIVKGQSVSLSRFVYLVVDVFAIANEGSMLLTLFAR